MVALGAEPSTLTIRMTSTGEPILEVSDLPAAVQSLAFSPDGKQVVAGMNDSTALVWDVPLSNP